MIAYSYGVYDILRAKDLQKLDRQIQVCGEDGATHFGIGVYETSLCQALGIDEPLKSIEDRMNIMKQIRGVDFVFPVNSLQEDVLKDRIKEAYTLFLNSNKEKDSSDQDKKYELGYAPGTYDLFNAGHLENLTIAANQCKKLIVGVKADELVFQHKGRKPVMGAEERMEILRHFKFVYDVYKYYTRDLNVATKWLQSKYNHDIDAVFLGSDLKKDFANNKDVNIIYTERNQEQMKTRSTTAYRKLHLEREHGKFTGNIPKELYSQRLLQ